MKLSELFIAFRKNNNLSSDDFVELWNRTGHVPSLKIDTKWLNDVESEKYFNLTEEDYLLFFYILKTYKERDLITKINNAWMAAKPMH